MHVGIDFDNTLVGYDRLFHRCAVDRGWMAADQVPSKPAIRACLQARPDGNRLWTELQGEVYGLRMREAELNPGAGGVLLFCRDRGIRVSIVSHKQQYPALGPRVDLREAAFSWLDQQGMLVYDRYGLRREDVYFEPDRASKIARIRQIQCTHFVDDLPEVLGDPSFPDQVRTFCYAGGSAGWDAVTAWISREPGL